MYNRYFPDDINDFSEFYRAVEYDDEKMVAEAGTGACKKEKDCCKQKKKFDLKRLLHGLELEKMGMLPLVLLLLLLLDVDDEERIIIIALAVVFGI